MDVQFSGLPLVDGLVLPSEERD